MFDGVQGCQRRRRNPTTAPGRRNHGRVPFSRYPAQSMVITGTGSWSKFKVIISCIRNRADIPELSWAFPRRQAVQSSSRPRDNDRPPVSYHQPKSPVSRCYAPAKSSSRSDSDSSSVRRSQMEVPFPCQMRRPRIPENENGGPVSSCKPMPNLECQTNSLTYLCVMGSALQWRRRLDLIFLLRLVFLLHHLRQLRQLFLLFLFLLLLLLIVVVVVPFDAGTVEKCHEGLWGQAKLL
jgi:hypothetical protein